MTSESDKPPAPATPDLASKSTWLVHVGEMHCGTGWLFLDNNRPYARIRRENRTMITEVGSSLFKQFLTWIGFNHDGQAPGTEAVNGACRLAAALAQYETRITHNLNNRVAEKAGAFYWDCSDDYGNAVKIEPGRWRLEHELHAPMFKRYMHQKAGFQPRTHDDNNTPDGRRHRLERLFELVNHDTNFKKLFLVDFVASFVPDIPHPVSVFFGTEGSGKSSTMHILKMLIDPSQIDSLDFPRRKNELIQNLDHHYCADFDNVSDLKQWQSDVLCRAVTGAGFSKRQLYTDDEDFIYSFKRKIMLNGINNPAENPDLLNRSILYELEDIEECDRLTEKELVSRLNMIGPDILGAVFDTLAEALVAFSSIELSGYYRMADFTKWGVAIAESLGIDTKVFLDEYERNQERQIEAAIENDVIGSLIISLIEEPPTTKGLDGTEEPVWPEGGPIKERPTDFYGYLEERAIDKNVSTNANGWPGDASALGRRLNELKSTLKRRKPSIIFERGNIGSDRGYIFRHSQKNKQNRVNRVNASETDQETLSEGSTTDAISNASKTASSDKSTVEAETEQFDAVDAVDAIVQDKGGEEGVSSKQSDNGVDTQSDFDIAKSDILGDYCSKLVTVADENDLVSDDELRKLFRPINRMIEIRTKLFDNDLIKGISAGIYQITPRAKDLAERVREGGAQ